MSPAAIEAGKTALRLRVTGLVQGVGFRPFVYRLAERHRLAGWVRNAAGEVQIEVEGLGADLDAFVGSLRSEAPPLARIEGVEAEPRIPSGTPGFRILSSAAGSEGSQPVSPDVALCGRCEAELFDPANRRHRYPFITCTDCGPRFTVIESLPFDRVRTSMRVFEMCPECRREYESPRDRRHHSETNCCAACGPRVWLEGLRSSAGGSRQSGGSPDHPASDSRLPADDGSLPDADPIAVAVTCLRDGAIVAIRGLGGFHLAVDATNDDAVQRLRRRKHRDSKPFAVMVRTLNDARRLGLVGPAEAALLCAPERPVVLLSRWPAAGLAPSVAPGLATVGVMIAYTPLHHLLLDLAARPLVMTSGNRSEEPIVTSNAQARETLGRIADVFLLHDREIVARYDDSVVRVAGEEAVFLRRARGYAPFPLELPVPSPAPLVGVGPQLKNTFTLASGSRAYVSQHIGDLDDADTSEHFLETLRLYQRLFRIEPVVAVRDLHPDYLSTRIAEGLRLSRVIAVQHHHAHIAAVMAEHDVAVPVVGIAYDGAGYGDDGNVWGSETMVADLRAYRRVGHLRYAPLPGGDLGARRPWRAALGYLSLDRSAGPAFRRAFAGINPRELDMAEQQISQRLNAPLASSMGRLFDAAAAVLGVRQASDYEGQAAMELEALAGRRRADTLPFPVSGESGSWSMDPLPLLEALGSHIERGDDATNLAAAFHESVAAATADLATRVCREEDLDTVVLGGGVFQNTRLVGTVKRMLSATGVRVLLPRRLAPNDGAISYGQAAVVAAKLAQETGLCA